MIKTLHLDAKPSNDTTRLYGIFNHVNEVIFEEVNSDLVRQCAIRSIGLQGPLGLDSNFLSNILCNSTFGNTSDDLCHAIALLA